MLIRYEEYDSGCLFPLSEEEFELSELLSEFLSSSGSLVTLEVSEDLVSLFSLKPFRLP